VIRSARKAASDAPVLFGSVKVGSMRVRSDRHEPDAGGVAVHHVAKGLSGPQSHDFAAKRGAEEDRMAAMAAVGWDDDRGFGPMAKYGEQHAKMRSREEWIVDGIQQETGAIPWHEAQPGLERGELASAPSRVDGDGGPQLLDEGTQELGGVAQDDGRRGESGGPDVFDRDLDRGSAAKAGEGLGEAEPLRGAGGEDDGVNAKHESTWGRPESNRQPAV
jgi:hypothetical protein